MFFFLGMKWAYKITKPQFQTKGKMFFDRVWLTPKPSVLSEIQWMDSVEMEILEAYLDPIGAFQMEMAKIKFNAQRAIDELSSKM